MKTFISALLLALALGVSGGIAPAGFSVDTACFKVMFADPGQPALARIDCRFLLPGWIRALTKTENGAEVFRTRPLLRSHPASGCAEELVPAIPVSQTDAPGRMRKLKLGVGVIDEDIEYSFYADPVQLFPWETKLRRNDDGEWELTAFQRSGDHDGYAYELRVRVIVSAQSPAIRYEHELKNTGSRPLEFQAYFHPFFEATREYPDAWMLLPEHNAGLPEKIVSDRELEIVTDSAENPVFRTGAGRLGKYAVRISSDRPFSRVKIWSGPIDCFAVEPHIDLAAAPGETVAWTWTLTVR